MLHPPAIRRVGRLAAMSAGLRRRGSLYSAPAAMHAAVDITYFGHACLLFEWGKTRLLCDPWTSERGAFHAAWFQFPETTEIAKGVPRDPTHLYLSHEHQDHFDPTFLKGLSKETEILVSDHPSPWVRRGLAKLGLRKVRTLDSRVPVELDGARIAIITSD